MARYSDYKWRKEARSQGRCLPDSFGVDSNGWSSQDKFAAVVESAAMNAEQIAEYCRRRRLGKLIGTIGDARCSAMRAATCQTESGYVKENV